MNTNVHTWLYTNQTDQAVLHDVQRLFNSFERRLSRFNSESELSRLNGCQQAQFKASPILIDAVEVALLAAEATGGLYDPTILEQLELAGYDRSFEKLAGKLEPGQVAPSAPRSLPFSRRSFTFRSIQVDRARSAINKPVGLRLDLGGMGKGWTVDRAADRLQGLGPFLVNAGGDIFAYHSPAGQQGWQIDLVHPLKPDLSIARLYLHHRALATSTIAKRRWQQAGQLKHHLIDPRTGQPAQTEALSVSVIADRTVMAEIYAKVTLILGVKEGLAYLQSLPDVEGLIYTIDSKIVYTKGLIPLLARLEPEGYQA